MVANTGSLRKLHNTVQKFNRQFPVGTAVMLRKGTVEIATVVRAEAEVLGGHSAVGWFEGVSGCYSIENKRVRPMSLAKP